MEKCTWAQDLLTLYLSATSFVVKISFSIFHNFFFIRTSKYQNSMAFPNNESLFSMIFLGCENLDFKETRSVTMNIKKKKFFKSFVKIELSYVLPINMLSTAESCIEQ